ncbi:MAG: hypothetical protein FWD89_01495 [Firmicutes bacterium]|nr:hypothetical protein [Bacillota bacterium]MCL2770966.1 hypothetical protein [Bacillota bacterium]
MEFNLSTAKDAYNAIIKSKDIAELTAVMTSIDIADLVVLDGFRLNEAKAACSALLRCMCDYPQIRRSFNYFGTLEGCEQNKDQLWLKLNPDAEYDILESMKDYVEKGLEGCKNAFDKKGAGFAMHWWKENHEFFGVKTYTFSCLILNHRMLVDSVDSLKTVNQTNFKHLQAPSAASSIKALVDHEFGHIIDFDLKISMSREFGQVVRFYGTERLRKGLSQYAVSTGNSKEQEVLAEAFSEFRNSREPREIARRVVTMMEMEYRKIFRKPSGGLR